MLLVIVLVFLAVFAIVALVLTATGTGASQQTKRTLTVLEAALSSDTPISSDPIVDIRKKELFSAVPFINRFLLKLELAPRLRHLLYQANVKWTAGGRGAAIMLAGARSAPMSCVIPDAWKYAAIASIRQTASGA